MKVEVWLPDFQELGRGDGTWELEQIQANLMALNSRTPYQLGEHGHVTEPRCASASPAQMMKTAPPRLLGEIKGSIAIMHLGIFLAYSKCSVNVKLAITLGQKYGRNLRHPQIALTKETLF